jgi:hypothetical protein
MKKVGQWERRFRWGLILSFIGMVAGLIVSFVFVIVREVHLPGSVFSVIASIAAGKEVKSKKQRKQ